MKRPKLVNAIDVFGPFTGDPGNDLTKQKWRPNFSYAEERERGVGSKNILESRPWLEQHGKARFFRPAVARAWRWGRERERA